jgi:DNA-binding CsgD family transcriptional regulator
VLVFCDGPDTQALNPVELSRLFGFSPRESALAQALMNGQPLANAAGSLGVSHETVRSQLKSLFAKTDTNRQAELTAVLNKLRRWSGP